MAWPRNLRAPRPGDMPFILDSWQRSFSRSPFAGVVPNSKWMETARTLVSALLARGAKLVVACNPEDEDQILGWACAEEDDRKCVVHYVYVKDPYRKDGLSTELLGALLPVEPEEKPTFYTHRQAADTPGANLVTVLQKAGYSMTWAPEIARRKSL